MEISATYNDFQGLCQSVFYATRRQRVCRYFLENHV